MIKIIDNFLSKTYYKSILDILSGHNFDWKYLENITDPKDETKSVDNFGIKRRDHSLHSDLIWNRYCIK